MMQHWSQKITKIEKHNRLNTQNKECIVEYVSDIQSIILVFKLVLNAAPKKDKINVNLVCTI